MPTPSRSDVLDLSRSPGFRVVFKDRRPGFQDRVNNSPSFLHVVFAGEQGGISRHRVAEHPLIGIHLPGVRAASPGNLDLLHRFRDPVEDCAAMARFDEPSHPVGAHTAQSQHPELRW